MPPTSAAAIPLILLAALVPTGLQAQLERLDVPSGTVMVGGLGVFDNMDSRFNDGTTESLLGPAVPPVTGADADVNLGFGALDVGLGILPRVTIYGRVPLVRQRIRAIIRRGGTGPDSLVDTVLARAGDAEIALSYLVRDRWDRAGRSGRGSGGSGGHLGGSRIAIIARVRLPTGLAGDPNDPLSIGTGTGQTDVSLGLVGDWGSGNWGVRLAGTYTLRSAATIRAAIRSPRTPLDFAPPTANVRWTPGNAFHLTAQPFFRLAPALALRATVSYGSLAEDGFAYASPADAVPGVDPSVMADGTSRNSWTVGGGLTYSSPSTADPRGGRGLPVEAHISYRGIAGSGRGVVPKRRGVVVGLRFYFRLWGVAGGS